MISDRIEHTFESSGGPAAQRTSDARSTYDDRLNHILQAATELFARDGYRNASMRAIAEAAEVSLAGLYHYVASKEELLFHIQFRAFTSLLSNLRERLHGIDDPREQLAVMVRAHIDYFVSNMASLKACSHELDSLTGDAYDQTRRIRRDYYHETRRIIERVLEKHASRTPIDCHVAAMCLFGTLNWLYRWYNPRHDRSPASLARQITTQFLRGIVGVAAEENADQGNADAREKHA